MIDDKYVWFSGGGGDRHDQERHAQPDSAGGARLVQLLAAFGGLSPATRRLVFEIAIGNVRRVGGSLRH